MFALLKQRLIAKTNWNVINVYDQVIYTVGNGAYISVSIHR